MTDAKSETATEQNVYELNILVSNDDYIDTDRYPTREGAFEHAEDQPNLDYSMVRKDAEHMEDEWCITTYASRRVTVDAEDKEAAKEKAESPTGTWSIQNIDVRKLSGFEQKTKEIDVALPGEILSWNDPVLAEIVTHLKEEGVIEDEAKAVGLTLDVTVEEDVVVEEIEVKE